VPNWLPQVTGDEMVAEWTRLVCKNAGGPLKHEVPHLSPTIDPNDDYQRYVDEAKKFYSGPITLAKDLMKF
jgi:hypothetical protein